MTSDNTANLQPSAGDTAPDFSFKDMQGNTIKLSEIYTKKSVVLYFYPKDFTPGCTTEAKEFSKDYKIFREMGIEIIGISPDDEKSHEKFSNEMNIPYPLASDTENEISKRYGVYGPKSFMGKEYMGINRSTFLIEKGGKIIEIFRRVKPAGHSKEVIDIFKQTIKK